jgi:hypothetical protein
MDHVADNNTQPVIVKPANLHAIDTLMFGKASVVVQKPDDKQPWRGGLSAVTGRPDAGRGFTGRLYDATKTGNGKG